MGLFNLIKKTVKEKVDRIQKKTSYTKPKEFSHKTDFKPINKKVFIYKRDLDDMNKLALSENPTARVIDDTKYGINLKNGRISLPLRWYKSAQRKSAVMHGSGHLSITPNQDDLSSEEFSIYEKTKQIAEIVEDVRVNRYLCYKYPGMIRYLKEDEQEIMTDIAIGDLDESVSIPDSKFLEKGLIGEVFLDYKDKMRQCETYEEVLKTADDIYNELYKKHKKNKMKMPSPQQIAYRLLDIPEGCSPRIKMRQTANWGQPSHRVIEGELDWDQDTICKTVKKDKSKFLGEHQEIKTTIADKGLIKFLTKPKKHIRRTRDGKLNKIDPVRLITDNKIFKRNTAKPKTPRFYFILDCSGSMGSYSLHWMKTMALSLIKMLKQGGVNYTILCHSGRGTEFWYSEINEKDVPNVRALSYNLDGSMLKTVFEEYINKEESSAIFYFSDGGLPAEYPGYEAPLIKKYVKLSKKLKVPILGIGMNTQNVKVFDDWYVVETDKDLRGAIKKMGYKVRKSMR